MDYRPVTTAALWDSLEKRRIRRERIAKWLVLASPFMVALAVHLVW